MIYAHKLCSTLNASKVLTVFTLHQTHGVRRPLASNYTCRALTAFFTIKTSLQLKGSSVAKAHLAVNMRKNSSVQRREGVTLQRTKFRHRVKKKQSTSLDLSRLQQQRLSIVGEGMYKIRTHGLYRMQAKQFGFEVLRAIFEQLYCS